MQDVLNRAAWPGQDQDPEQVADLVDGRGDRVWSGSLLAAGAGGCGRGGGDGRQDGEREYGEATGETPQDGSDGG